MKKTIKLISVLLILLLLCIVINNNHSKTNQVLKGSFNNNQKEFNTTDALALMYEIDAGSGEYQTSSDTTWPEEGYVFNATLSRCENGGIVSWNEETRSVIIETNVSDKCYVYFDKELILFADYIKGLYTSQGTNGIYYHTSSLANSAEDNSYRYAGKNPNNYVCFGSDAATCPEDNLYRIIGVFGSEIKLIKSTRYGYYAWDSNNSNTWDNSTKPDIRSTLNTTYYNSLSATWQNKIATHTWKVGGTSYDKINKGAQTFYNYEVGSNSSSTPDSMKIGLMYVSDYGFAASPDYWTTALSEYNSAISANWLYLGAHEWTVSRNFSYTNRAFFVHSSGYVGNRSSYLVTNSIAVRPSFYLTSSTTYVSGTGTSSDPFRIT